MKIEIHILIFNKILFIEKLNFNYNYIYIIEVLEKEDTCDVYIRINYNNLFYFL